MEAKHTPGPWNIGCKAHGVNEGFVIRSTVDDGGGAIAISLGNQSDECKSNAALIAAAPDMYEALRAVEREIGPEDRATSRKVRAALAKAEGR